MKFFILAAFLTVSLASEQDCPRACPTYYDPVCTKSTDGIYKTFGNLCELQIQNCKHQETGYEFMKKGKCSDDQMHILCTDQCLDDFDPVCAQTDDGRLLTYPNLCEFEKDQCESGGKNMKLIKNGECNEYSKKIMGCPVACTEEYKPVCTKSSQGEMKTFSNKCQFEMYKCQNGDFDLQMLREGSCSVEPKKIMECPVACTEEYKPVCTKSSQGEMKTFSNKCQFEMYKCQNGDFDLQMLGEGSCSVEPKKIMECPVACTEEYKPVCTKSSQGEMKTFSNKCQFEMYKCQNGDFDLQMLREGSCSVEPQKNMRCPVVCSKEYKPLCTKSSNGEMKTFTNMCEFEMYQCQNRNLDLQILREGACSVEPNNNMKCPVACMDIYEPICVQNIYGKLVTFNNKCQFQLYACNHVQTDLRFYKNGRC